MGPIRPSAVALAATFLVACGTSRAKTESVGPPSKLIDAGEGNRPYYAGTPVQQQQVKELVARLAVTSGEDLLALDQKILRFGEPAIPPLLEAQSSSDPRVRAQAAYLLGALRDRRTLDALAKASTDPVPTVRYEAAAGLVEMGDDRGASVLIGGLSDPDARLRAKCVDILASQAGDRLGYEAVGQLSEREEAIRRWNAWLARRRLLR